MIRQAVHIIIMVLMGSFCQGGMLFFARLLENMTPWEILEKIQERITEEIPKVVKVLYDITPKPPSTIEYI